MPSCEGGEVQFPTSWVEKARETHDRAQPGGKYPIHPRAGHFMFPFQGRSLPGIVIPFSLRSLMAPGCNGIGDLVTVFSGVV
jgi:hypothetical protein